MTEELRIGGTSREQRYQSLILQIRELIGNELDHTAVLSNVTAALKQTFYFFWVGFYLV